MKIKATGINGFVGSNLKNYLGLRDIELFEISRLELNLVNEDLLKGTDSVIHLAGKAHDLKNADNPDEYYQVNYELTKNLYDAFLKSDAEKFIFISSVKAVADSVKDVLTEDIMPAPETHYGKSKLMAEQYIQAQQLPIGKSYYILRPCMIHGPGNKGNLNLLYKFVQKGIPYPLASFNNKRSFLSVKNLCFIIKKILIGNGMPSGIYNVADDDALSTNEVVSILSSSINKRPKLWFISKKVIEFVAKAGDLIKLPLNTERLHKLTENYIVSNKKIKMAIGSQLPVKTKEGLLITANSFKG